RWTSVLGTPKKLRVDPAGEHVSDEMRNAMEADDTELEISAGEAHWQNGDVEVFGKNVEEKFAAILREHPPADDDEWEIALQSAMYG
ncbi:MAG: hypothetical protein AAEJ59_01495, partial [Arenicellales bacterium]